MKGLGIKDLTNVEDTKRALLCESILITRLTKQLELFDEAINNYIKGGTIYE